MAVVAVLLIHMDKKAVTPMKPSINLPRRVKETNTVSGLESNNVWPLAFHNQQYDTVFIYLRVF